VSSRGLFLLAYFFKHLGEMGDEHFDNEYKSDGEDCGVGDYEFNGIIGNEDNDIDSEFTYNSDLPEYDDDLTSKPNITENLESYVNPGKRKGIDGTSTTHTNIFLASKKRKLHPSGESILEISEDSTKMKMRNLNKGNSVTPGGMTDFQNMPQRTTIVNKISDIKTKKFVKKPLKKDPNLFTIDVDIAPAYQEDEAKGEEVVQDCILKEFTTRITSAKKSKLTPPGDSNNESIDRNISVLYQMIDLAKNGPQSEMEDVNKSFDFTEGLNSDSSTKNLIAPNVEELTRMDVQNNLRGVIPDKFEQACISGDECESVHIWKMLDSKMSMRERNKIIFEAWIKGGKKTGAPFLLPEKPFVCRGMLLPSEERLIQTERRSGKPLKEIMESLYSSGPPKVCILCDLYISQQITNKRKSNLESAKKWCGQTHSNIFGKPGEYILEVMRTNSYVYCGVDKPIKSYDRTHYFLGHYYVWTEILDVSQTSTVKKNEEEMHRVNSVHGGRSLSTLIPEGYATKNAEPPKALLNDVCKILDSVDVTVTSVPGWLEIDSIIFKPTINDQYVKYVTDLSSRYFC
jgi:hypothetical protein